MINRISAQPSNSESLNPLSRAMGRFSLLLAVSLSAGCSQKAPANDAVFLDALRIADSGNTAQLDQYQMAMQGSVLQYYPDYWKLNNDLSMQPASAIVAFAQRYPNSALAEKLAADYLEEKSRAGDLRSAAPVVVYVNNPDTSEQCAMAQIQAASGDPLALVGNKQAWLATSTQPETCVALARMMLASPLISAEDRQQRLYAMLRSGQIGQAFAVANTMGAPLSLSQLNQIATNPGGYLFNAPKATAQDHAYLIFALGRLADRDLSSTLTILDRVASGTPEQVQRYLYRTVAYIAGTTVMKNGFNPAIPGLFDRSYGYPFSVEEAEIYARQAIRFGQWESLIRAINSMPPNMQQEARWQYWLARASQQRRDIASQRYAEVVYHKLARSDDEYHGLLAQDRLGQSYQLPGTATASDADVSRLAGDVNFQRAFALRVIGAPADYANREWNWAVRQAALKHDDGLLLAAAQRANGMAWYDRAIYAADRTIGRHNAALRYPVPYRSNVISGSQVGNIPPAWAYGIMRQESRFTVNARSGVGASGLMQVMPTTAQLIARKLGEPYSANTYAQLNTNIRYGTYYLGMLQSQLGGNMVLATAGYNAGPNRARAWQPDLQMLSADQYAESIPLAETRDYVKNVMSNTVHYAAILGQPNPRISQYMPPVGMAGQ